MGYKPCPFESGLRKFAIDPVVVIFFKNFHDWNYIEIREEVSSCIAVSGETHIIGTWKLLPLY
jgi:hypothetical protein